MKTRGFRRLIAAAAGALLLAAGASAPAGAAPPPCENPTFCEWEFECLYVGPDGNLVLSCRIIKRCYCF